MIELIAILTLALAVIAYALMPGRRRHAPIHLEDVWDEEAQRWTVRPAAKVVPDAALDLRFLEELDAHLNTYANQDPDLHETFGTNHTSTAEEAGDA